MELLVNIDVDDLARAEAFYGGVFGLRVSRRFGDDGVELAGGSSRIHLLRKAAGSSAGAGAALRGYGRHWTPVHVDFLVDDVAAAVARAEAAGATVERPIEAHAWGSIAGLADPFGHGLCIIQLSARGYDAIATSPAP